MTNEKFLRLYRCKGIFSKGVIIVDDEKIVELYHKRDESAITETKAKYGKYCYTIAHRILNIAEDAEECESDTYLMAWNTIPPKKPNPLAPYLAKITRGLSIDKWRKSSAQKRGGTDVFVSMQELEECIPSDKTIEETIDDLELAKMISLFLRSLPETECNVFLNRYWFFLSIKDICEKYSFSQSKVKMMLLRTREKLLSYLEKEGIFI